MEKKPLLKAMMENFKREGQGAVDFKKELDALTPEDKAWFIKEFQKSGQEIEQK